MKSDNMYEIGQHVRTNYGFNGVYLRPQPETPQYWKGHWIKSEDGKEFIVEDHSIYPFKRLTESQKTNTSIEQRPIIVKLLNDAAKQLIPVQYDEKIYCDSDSVIIGETGITIEPGTAEIRTIKGWEEIFVWEIKICHQVPATRECPSDIQLERLNSPIGNEISTVMEIINIWQKMIALNYFEKINVNEGLRR